MGENTHQNCTRQNKNKEDPGRQQPCWGLLFCTNLTQPTRGVDVNAKFEIYSVINELAKAGIAVIMVSSELPEIINMCDNVCVIKAGRMTGMLGREELDQEKIMQYAAGGEE